MPHRTDRLRPRCPVVIQLWAFFLAWLMAFSSPTQPLGATPPPANEHLNSRGRSTKVYQSQQTGEGKEPSASLPVLTKAPPDRTINPPRKDLSCSPDTDHYPDPAKIADVVRSSVNEEAEKWGDINIAQPKIWEFERVSTMLDGLLRDVEGVSLGDLTQLDPNAQNAAALKFIQSALEVGVQYDQAAAVNATNALQNFQAVHSSQIEQLDEYNTYMQTLTGERARLAGQLTAANNEVNILQPLSDAGIITTEQATRLSAAKSRQSNLQSSLTSMNSLISGAGAVPTLTAPPTVTGTSVQAPASGSNISSSLSGFADVLKNLPQGVTNNLTTALQSPSYPATKRLDNFITLLYERLAREISVLQDDLMRDPDNVPFLLQFDVGLYPSKKANDHVARVEFSLACPGCKVYSIYPGQSAYNLANYSGASKRNSFWGNALTLIGLGVSASYRRQEDTLQGSLVQSVYTAGFQDGMLDERSDGSQSLVVPDNSKAEQRFGWYYGPAPFEKLVSPGIRTTFAMVTVPRKLVEPTEDVFGNSNACLALHIIGGWANRNDPLAQDSYLPILGQVSKLSDLVYFPKRHPLVKPPQSETGSDSDSTQTKTDASVVRRMTSVKLPGRLEDFPLVVTREEQKLHVVSLEYNTVYETTAQASSASPAAAAITATQGSSPGSAVAAASNASGTGGTAGAFSAALDPLPCPKDECAAMLLKIDRPIDPNLVITVRGQPLQRVRDWRGRATSILPAAQSLSDQVAQAAGTVPASGAASGSSTQGTATARQVVPGRSLLESDKLGPNSWFALNSHELLLTISREVASDDEFPVIQISDPSDTVIIPHELQQSTTELIINGFRMYPQSSESLNRQITINYANKRIGDAPDPGLSKVPTNRGPYPFSTYVPLFMPDPSAQGVYARVGETSEELLVGFTPNRTAPRSGGSQIQYPEWKEGQTQVILEDRDLDLAWSLSCTVQGIDLACRVPRSSIVDAYRTFANVCQSGSCPTLETTKQSFLSVINSLTPGTGKSLTAEDFAAIGNLYVPTLELWVLQSDPEGKYTFYSPQPAPINFFPLSSSYWSASKQFEAWHFVSANPDDVTVEGCNYDPGAPSGASSITVLGTFTNTDIPINQHIEPAPKPTSRTVPLTTSIPTGCQEFDVTTSGLSHDQIVFLLNLHTGPNPTMVLDTSTLRPIFGHPRVQYETGQIVASDGSKQYRITKWTVDVPAHRVAFKDSLDLPPGLSQTSFESSWRQGQTELTQDSWAGASDTDSISLHIEMTREALMFLPQDIALVRTSTDGTHRVPVAILPSIPKLVLPSQLELDPISPTQFALRGENATAIDAVAVQNGTTTQEVGTATGVDFALFTVTTQSSNNSTPAPAAVAGAIDNSGQTTIVTTNNNSATVKMTTSNKNAGPASKSPTPAGKTSVPTGQSNPPGLKPGTYTVLPLMIVCEPQASGVPPTPAAAGKQSATPTTCTPVALSVPSLQAAAAETKPSQSAAKGQASKATGKVVPPTLQPKAPTVPAPKLLPIYVPLDVSDNANKPLSLTLADASKQSASNPSSTSITPTSNCAVPCLLLPCTAICSQPTNPAVTGKSQ